MKGLRQALNQGPGVGMRAKGAHRYMCMPGAGDIWGDPGRQALDEQSEKSKKENYLLEIGLANFFP